VVEWVRFWQRLGPTARRLLMARASRSLGQGALLVTFALYLKDLGWTATAIGLLMTATAATSSGLSLMLGVLSDRTRRKPFLLGYSALVTAAGAVGLLTAVPWLLIPATLAGGFGRGQSGAAGPFAPIENAWLGRETSAGQRPRAFSLNSGMGFIGMGLGAVLAGGVAPLVARFGAAGYRPLFALVGVAGVLTFALVVSAGETTVPVVAAPAAVPRPRRLLGEDAGFVLRLAVCNTMNGLAVGIAGPLMSYWFALRYHVGPLELGPMFAVAFLLTGVVGVGMGSVSERWGLVNSVAGTRVAGVALLVAMPLMPAYAPAAAAYVLRSALNRGTVGPRMALIVGAVSDQRRATATSISTATSQGASAIGPTLAGLMFDSRLLALPFLIAAGLQLAYAGVYWTFFRRYEPHRP
jgi:MFS family permease